MSKRKHTNRCNIGLGKALNEATCIYNLPSYIVANARGKEVQHILQDAPLVSSWEGASNVRLGSRKHYRFAFEQRRSVNPNTFSCDLPWFFLCFYPEWDGYSYTTTTYLLQGKHSIIISSTLQQAQCSLSRGTNDRVIHHLIPSIIPFYSFSVNTLAKISCQ